MKKNNKKGFTLAELLIVVAIIAVLTAIAIPVFTAQLEKSRESADLANVRSAYAELVAGYLEKDGSASIKVPVTQTKANWQTTPSSAATTTIAAGQASAGGTKIGVAVPAKTTGTYDVKIDGSGNVKVE